MEGYPPEFRRRVLDLVESGRSVVDVARDLQISQQTIYVWRRQDRIDRGLEPGRTSAEKAELADAKRRIAELGPSLAARSMSSRRTPTQRRFAAIKVMAADGLPVQVACRVLDVSEARYCRWLTPHHQSEPYDTRG